ARRHLRQDGGPGGIPADGAPRVDHHPADRRVDRAAVLLGARGEVTYRGSGCWSRGRIIARTTAVASTAISNPGCGSDCTPTMMPAGGLRRAKKSGAASRIRASVPGLMKRVATGSGTCWTAPGVGATQADDSETMTPSRGIRMRMLLLGPWVRKLPPSCIRRALAGSSRSEQESHANVDSGPLR